MRKITNMRAVNSGWAREKSLDKLGGFAASGLSLLPAVVLPCSDDGDVSEAAAASLLLSCASSSILSEEWSFKRFI